MSQKFRLPFDGTLNIDEVIPLRSQNLIELFTKECYKQCLRLEQKLGQRLINTNRLSDGQERIECLFFFLGSFKACCILGDFRRMLFLLCFFTRLKNERSDWKTDMKNKFLREPQDMLL